MVTGFATVYLVRITALLQMHKQYRQHARSLAAIKFSIRHVFDFIGSNTLKDPRIDRTHPRIDEIEEMLNEMSKRLRLMGYSPNTNEVSYDVDEDKETTLFRHSEKLAIAFGLIANSPLESIRIIKNLRICNDCHEAAKLVSMAFNREIVIRDRHGFHHFKDGSCSCKEYW